ncbi:unnamed protein product [Spirodela intermedia]|uniref:Uncharacterized protein n=1 Tax=Spirodela intermedia TaxID=51605 RepID=A0A7I8K4W9_SPIIN|nr:unnamed protein product [Spirodela intermedia]
MHGCKADGDLDDSGFTRPMPLIGLYIASVSLVCAVLMGLDLVEGLRRRRFWFPSRFFSLNAATLTLLGVAVKLPVDINTAMPGRWDQLTKLSGTVLVCTAMGNAMPSLGVKNCAFSDTFALVILVITVIANMVTEMSTGVIYVFWSEHIIVMSIMLVLLAITISSALFVSTTKHCLGKKYDFIRGEIGDDPEISVECLERCVEKYSLMAYASNSQHVLGRSATCAASGAFCFLAVLVFVRAVTISLLGESRGFCSGESDYKWTTSVVLLSQALSIFIGTAAPVSRYLVSSRNQQMVGRSVVTVEEYWVGRLKAWRDSPLFRGVHQWSFMPRIAWYGFRWTMNTLIAAQAAVVIFCNLVSLPSVWLVLCVTTLCRMCSSLGRQRRERDLEASEVSGGGRGAASDAKELSRFVLLLEGEDQLAAPIMRSGRWETQNSFKKGRKRRPMGLVDTLREHSSVGFRRVGEFGIISSDEAHQDLPEHNSWALPTVALASIVFLIPGVECGSVRSLLRGVGEGLKYVRLVDKHLDEHGLVNASEAADILWEKVDLFGGWLFRKLHESTGVKGEVGVKEILEGLEKMGKDCMERELSRGRRGGRTCPWDWPPKALAGYYLQRIGRAIRQRDGKDLEPEGLFRWLCETIADVLGACLTNLPRVVLMECICSGEEEREEGVREAALLLGESRELLRFLEEKVEVDGHRYPHRDVRHRIDAWASRPEPDNHHI